MTAARGPGRRRPAAGGHIGVLGAGSWGTALAIHLGRLGHRVVLWARDPSLADELSSARINRRYLPGASLPPNVRATADVTAAVAEARCLTFAVPSHGLRAVARQAAGSLTTGAVLVSASKGLESGTHLRMSQVLAEEARTADRIVALSGPSFASEVARALPTAVLAASADPAAARTVQEDFGGASLRVYASDDVVGVETGGALKNVIAIAAGVVQGLELGHNAMAALITRGLAEISRLAVAEGGRRETLAGLSGLGDLVLTCTGELSRNRHVGIELGRGRRLADVLGGMRMVAEGVRTTSAALALGERHGIELPIAAQMNEVLEGRRTPREAVETLMVRPQKWE